ASISARSAEERSTLEALRPAVERLGRLRPLTIVAEDAALSELEAGGTLVVIAGNLEAKVDAGRALGPAERARLERELAEAQTALERVEERLANPQFATRAPADVVAGASTHAAELRERIDALRARMG